jgi:hypothetical protein
VTIKKQIPCTSWIEIIKKEKGDELKLSITRIIHENLNGSTETSKVVWKDYAAMMTAVVYKVAVPYNVCPVNLKINVEGGSKIEIGQIYPPTTAAV